MSTKAIGIALIIIVMLALAVSLLADCVELGSGPAEIGWKQLLGTGIGLVIAVVGVVLAIRKKKS